jgi:hypothetical protein
VATALLLGMTALGCGGDDSGTDDATATSDVTTTTAANGGRRCEGRWPSVVNREPTRLAAADTTAYYLWSDLRGWHVRFVNADGAPHRAQGRVVASARIVALRPVPEELAGVTMASNVVTFDMETQPAAVGFDVNVGCQSATVRFELSVDGEAWPVESIFLGHEGSALTNPVIVDREGLD